MIETDLRARQRPDGILLMTHIVVGYPSIEASERIVDVMVEAGVDIIELQLPFSEPMADGPVIVRANQEALERGCTVEAAFQMAQRVCTRHPIPFVLMTYYNPIVRMGHEKFVGRMQDARLRGAIVPDLPPEEGEAYFRAMSAAGLDPILIVAPTSSQARLAEVARFGSGFLYCVARTGVTGSKTRFSDELLPYLNRCRQATTLPLALGFGIRTPDDVGYLRDKVEIAVVGSETLRVVDTGGIDAVAPFLASLRPWQQG